MARKTSGDQLSLFPGIAPEAADEPAGQEVGAAEAPEEVAALGRELPRGVYLGPSSWSFPGWAGIVYDRRYPESRLAREGLAAVGRYPVIRGAGIDRTHYAPVAAEELAAYAAEVPEDFRFLVKAHEALTLARFPDRPRYGRERGLGNPHFLDASYATDAVVAPYLEGLGPKGGALLFQFAPQDVGPADSFLAELRSFLLALPFGPIYAIELRNRELLTPRYAGVLAETGAVHCANAHPRMPDVRTQMQLAGKGQTTVVRWLLARGDTYEAAGRRYAPFDRLQAEDPPTRGAIAELVREALADGRPALVTVNNNAEGSAPLSISLLAEEIVRPG
jgi:uncharacterized protein YecE (DUF72 family)